LICTEFYDGQGLGNQLWLYAVTRVKSLDMKCDFGIMHPEKFKGMKFLNLDFGRQVFGGRGPEGGPPEHLPIGFHYYFREHKIEHPVTGQDITGLDPLFHEIQDFTKIDGNFQSPLYIRHRKLEIRNWFTPIGDSSENQHAANVCIVNFRGGEYRHMKSVFLPANYWESAREIMLDMNPKMRFRIVTDDPKLASEFFPKSEIVLQRMEKDYRAILAAEYLILSNSSFGWFPAWLNTTANVIIAPKYWWGFNNNEYWSTSAIYTEEFSYLDKNAQLEFGSVYQ